VAKIKYLGKTATNINLNPEDIKSRLISGNACYHSVQSTLCCSLLSEKVKVKIKTYSGVENKTVFNALILVLFTYKVLC
jgi:hypothetical protein